MNKVISLEEAARRVEPGMCLALGGITLYRRPVAFVRALIRHFAQVNQPAKLNLVSFTAAYESDLLVGAGLVKQVHSCYFGLEIFGLAPMFTYRAGQGELEIFEESEASLALGLRAAIAGIGFMPGRAWLGTDLPALRPDVRTIIDPYTGEELPAFPAIQPDVAVLHTLRADPDGNALLGGNKAVDEDLSLASRFVIVTAEEVVSQLEKADIAAPLVDAVVLAPRGAAPASCHPLYSLDGEALLRYTQEVSDPASFARYLASLE